ncbi:ubiquitin-like domain-containing CTD phosphatase 1 isoform X2 [Dinothrombium tinctorium]|uniref:Ubiquitin-like domain-containing CTD phosphatase 1 n=1 Tax=Dinothrombium tinctorium TaxID=1965070 RepID=A0A443RC44_9ACAR|nr:ubiquitin-like domain-containing CTD phosphatase 1 isoform X2 [Dinothrombium tinctorium]
MSNSASSETTINATTSGEHNERSNNDLSIVIKWSGNEFVIDSELISESDSVAHLKQIIYKKTGVMPQRQKLLGLKVKGKPAADENKIGDLKLKPNTKIMMIGSREADIDTVANISPDEGSEVVNDFDIPEEAEIPLFDREEFVKKVERRVKEYKVKILNEPRPGKKLLVLDIDYTIFDHRSVAEHISQLMRPFLHEFLTSAYEDYDIVIWSATSMKWIEVKMRQLGVTTNPNYKIAFFLDSGAMINVYTSEYGLLDVKPLGVIWGKFSQYNAKNTIMFDDIRRNFLMNPQNGLRIKPFREAQKNRSKDRELIHLAKYLKKIASMDDLSSLNHKHWHRLVNND